MLSQNKGNVECRLIGHRTKNVPTIYNFGGC